MVRLHPLNFLATESSSICETEVGKGIESYRWVDSGAHTWFTYCNSSNRRLLVRQNETVESLGQVNNARLTVCGCAWPAQNPTPEFDYHATLGFIRIRIIGGFLTGEECEHQPFLTPLATVARVGRGEDRA